MIVTAKMPDQQLNLFSLSKFSALSMLWLKGIYTAIFAAGLAASQV